MTLSELAIHIKWFNDVSFLMNAITVFYFFAEFGQHETLTVIPICELDMVIKYETLPRKLFVCTEYFFLGN